MISTSNPSGRIAALLVRPGQQFDHRDLPLLDACVAAFGLNTDRQPLKLIPHTLKAPTLPMTAF